MFKPQAMLGGEQLSTASLPSTTSLYLGCQIRHRLEIPFLSAPPDLSMVLLPYRRDPHP